MFSLKRTGALLMALMMSMSAVMMTSCGKDKDGDKGSSSSKTSQSSSSSKKEDKQSSKSSKEDGSSSEDDKNTSKASDDKDASSSDSTGSAEALTTDPVSSLPPPPDADEYKSRNIYIINLDSGEMVWQRYADERISPASLTKVMTCILALENVKDLDTETMALTADINNYLYENQVNTLGGIAMGESFCIRDLLYAMMLQSANEAAMMIGKYVSKYGGAPEEGDLEVFYEMMNIKAKQIGANNTHFSNATGFYDENNYSTAHDLALIAKYAWEHPDYGETFQQIVSQNAYTSKPTNRMPDGITWYSLNKMQQSSQTLYYYEGLKGIKTGTLEEQNIQNFVSTATRDGYTYLMAVCGAPCFNEDGDRYKNNIAFLDTKSLYEWVFKTFQVKTLINVGDDISSIHVDLAWDKDTVNLVAADKFAALVTNETTSDTINKIPYYPNAEKRTIKGQKEPWYFVDAPIEKGQELGYVKITTAGNLELGTVRLVAAETVARSEWLYYVDKVKTFMGKFVFKFILTFVIVLVALYIVLMIIRNHNRRRYRTKRRPPRTPPRR